MTAGEDRAQGWFREDKQGDVPSRLEGSEAPEDRHSWGWDGAFSLVRSAGVHTDDRLAPPARADIEEQEVGMQIVAQRNREKEKDDRVNEGGPFLKGRAGRKARLSRPNEAPDGKTRQGDQQPKNIEENFHASRGLPCWAQRGRPSSLRRGSHLVYGQKSTMGDGSGQRAAPTKLQTSHQSRAISHICAPAETRGSNSLGQSCYRARSPRSSLRILMASSILERKILPSPIFPVRAAVMIV